MIFPIDSIAKWFRNGFDSAVFTKIYTVVAVGIYNIFAKWELNRKYRLGVIVFTFSLTHTTDYNNFLTLCSENTNYDTTTI